MVRIGATDLSIVFRQLYLFGAGVGRGWRLAAACDNTMLKLFDWASVVCEGGCDSGFLPGRSCGL